MATIRGDDSDNDLVGTDLDDIIYGYGGRDRLDGRSGADLLVGGLGDDHYIVDDGGDVARETDFSGGSDTVESSVSFSLAGSYLEDLVFTGSAAVDARGNGLANRLVGNSAANLLIGAAGADTLIGGAGADTMNGGAGDDRYFVDDAGDRAIETGFTGGMDSVHSSVSYSLVGQYIEILTLTGAAASNGTGNKFANILVGNGADNLLAGGEGADDLQGRAGHDVLDGGGGGDVMNGGIGNDSYVVDDAADRVLETSITGGADQVHSSVSFSLSGAYVERLTLTGVAAIDGTGNRFANTIVGNGAANRLDGGAGSDRLIGGYGDDLYVVDASGDVVVERDLDGGTDTVETSVTFSAAGHYIENITLIGSAAVDATGTDFANLIEGNGADNSINGRAGDDTLMGNAGNDTLWGEQGDDYIDGGDGNDSLDGGGSEGDVLLGGNGDDTLFGGETMYGGDGNDTYFVDQVDQIIVEHSFGNAVRSRLSDYTLPENVETLFLVREDATGRGNDQNNRLHGSVGEDRLHGMGGDDWISGGGHNDRDHIFGGLGNDVIIGGSGHDDFYFDTALSASNVDTIMDFAPEDTQRWVPGEHGGWTEIDFKDELMLDRKVFTALGDANWLSPNEFHAGTSAGDATDRIIYDAATGNIFYDADGSGGIVQILFANVGTFTAEQGTLTHENFHIYG